jgi:hypothetical protein
MFSFFGWFARSERVALKRPRKGTVVEMDGVKFDPPQTVQGAYGEVVRQRRRAESEGRGSNVSRRA